LRLAVLAQKMNFVPEPRQGLCEACVVDIAARAAQQVAVKDQDADTAG
jgi:hypothetical protein